MTSEGENKAGVLEVLDPVAAVAAKAVSPARRLSDLSGRKIGLYSNNKPGADVVLAEIAKLLGAKFHNLKFENFCHSYPHGNDILENMAKSGCDAIISASAD